MSEQNGEQTLSDMKLSLVLRDYDNWNHAASKTMDWKHKLRGWEVTVISAFSAALVTEISISPITVIPLFFIVGVLMILDARASVDLKMINDIILGLEQRLQCTDLEEFRKHILNWRFSTTLYHERKPKSFETYKQTLLALIKEPTLRIWHFPLIAFALIWFLWFC